MIKHARLVLRSLLPGSFGKPGHPPATVAQVDLDRLLGTWFAGARLPNLNITGAVYEIRGITPGSLRARRRGQPGCSIEEYTVRVFVLNSPGFAGVIVAV
jgi:hypothetical protein